MIVDALKAYKDEIVVLALGPATNFRLAEKDTDGILKNAKGIYMMGGGFGKPFVDFNNEMAAGNIRPWAEFNVYFDPISTAVLFEKGNNVQLFPLDVTTAFCL